MYQLILKAVLFFVALSLPLITEIPSLDPIAKAHFPLLATKDGAVLARLALIFPAVAISFIVDYFSLYKPLKNITKIQNEIFDSHLKVIVDKWHADGLNVRLNVMKADRQLFGLFFKLRTVYHCNFDTHDSDYYLTFYSSRLRFLNRLVQGNCGLCFKDQQIKYSIINGQYNFNLNNQKLQRTSGLKGIISIPIFSKPDNGHKVIGVLNIDTMDEAVINRFKQYENQLKTVIKQGKTLSTFFSHFL